MTPEAVRLGDLIDHVQRRYPDGNPLLQLEAAVETSAYLGDVADHLIGHFVDQARRSGASWTDIGSHMGVSKQAAQKRFVSRAPDDDQPGRGLLHRFTKRARHVTVLARKEAELRGHGQVGPQHLLLGLLGEPEGLAVLVLQTLGADPQRIRAALDAAYPPVGGGKRGRANFSRPAKTVLELSLREAKRLRHNYIGTEHLLLGILRSDDPAAAVLHDAGVTVDAAAETVQELLAARH